LVEKQVRGGVPHDNGKKIEKKKQKKENHKKGGLNCVLIEFKKNAK